MKHNQTLDNGVLNYLGRPGNIFSSSCRSQKQMFNKTQGKSSIISLTNDIILPDSQTNTNQKDRPVARPVEVSTEASRGQIIELRNVIEELKSLDSLVRCRLFSRFLYAVQIIFNNNINKILVDHPTRIPRCPIRNSIRFQFPL